MNDQELVDDFFRSLPGGEFHHRDHLRLAWLAVRRRDVERAVELVAAAITAFATAHGQARKFHWTLTEFWVRLVDHARRTAREPDDFDALLAEFPLLLDPQLPQRHWSAVVLWSEPARERWLAPDLQALPG